ncbi:uncharacterized protein YaaN involved in tellurite resistance [Rhizobium aethiopicum]|uniref:Uncharacterized protein YaaN involved in tellurite resistance n=1 Tax=Rhizobium aethiopicum TaxID=1138170 RepID=A0A7W6Q7W7_9HYPH|nr:uncharacterized protein YaaN involved in tellurite resistance [Rhizobium aethiopicum]MBB4579961.1 uncharacterized protein YaaN involved in tellurite resistance [Rhizobium aethiopicum]
MRFQRPVHCDGACSCEIGLQTITRRKPGKPHYGRYRSRDCTECRPAGCAADPAEVARISDSIDITDRAGISVYGDRAQQAVSDYADRILREVRNKDLGEVGRLLTDIILKSKSLDPASLKDKGFLSRMFLSAKARLERFKEEFEDVAGQIDRIGLELDRHNDTLRRDIAR